MMGRRRLIWVTFGACVILLAALSPQFAERASATSYTSVVHPDAAAQPTATGRTLRNVDDYEGRVYAGYGDYGVNTGPIAIRPYDPNTRAFGAVEFVQDTEAIETFRTIDGKLWSPAIDTRVGYDFAVRADGVWSEPVSEIPSWHVYDIAQRVPGELFLSGSTYADCAVTGCDGAVWRSTDGGATWAFSFTEPGNPNYGRCFNMVAFQNKAYVQCSTGRYVFDGATWRTTSQPASLFGPEGQVVFDGRLVYVHNSELWAFDGATSIKIGRRGSPVVYGGKLYAFDGGRIYRTSDLDRDCGLLALLGTCYPEWLPAGDYPYGATNPNIVDGWAVLVSGSAIYQSMTRIA